MANLEEVEIEISDLTATIKSLSKSKKPTDVAHIKKLKATKKAKEQLKVAIKKQAKDAEKNESEEVKAAKQAQADAKAKVIAEAKARDDALEHQSNKNADRKRLSAERVAQTIEKAEALRKKKADERAKELEKQLKTPLSPEERIEMDALEKQANQGKNQPHALDMVKLSMYRIRSKIK